MKSSLFCFLVWLASGSTLCIDCQFKITKTGSIPSCVTKDLQVSSPNVFVDKIDGKHIKGNSNKKVKKIYIVDSPLMEYMPKGFEEFFVNLDGISIKDSGLKIITQANLEPFPNLKYLWLDNNKLETLPSGLFRFNPRLLFVSFQKNQLTTIADNLFDPVTDLQQADFTGNACIDLNGGNRYAVRIVMREISKKCQKPVEVKVEVAKSEPSYVLGDKCTSATFHSNRPIRGTSVVRGKFPFVAALLTAYDSKYFCGGSLITNKHVLTSAHCVQKKLEPRIDPEEVLVLLGRFNLNLPAERRSESREVEDIVVHEDWKSYSKNADGDLAIVILDYEVRFTNFIRPICLVDEKQDKAFNHGFTVGWGKEATGISSHNIHQRTHASKVGDEECAAQCPGCFVSGNVNCLKEDAADVCNNDSGRGFIIPYNNKLILKAIYSMGDKDCKNGGNAIFIEISKYSDWIKRIVKSIDRLPLLFLERVSQMPLLH